ncbi:ligand-binding sensor domain-containing protein [Aliikangiella sp. IMCC44632]
MKLLTIMLSSFLALFACAGSANNLDHRYQKAFRAQSLSLKQGLSQSVVYQVYQDSVGFIWVATEDGLNRFDGYEFEVFQHVHSNPNSLHNNYIVAITEQAGKGLWLGTQEGASFFDFKTQEFKSFHANNPDLKSFVNSILVNSQQQVLIGGDNGLFEYQAEQDQVVLFKSAANKSLDVEVVEIKAYGEQAIVATESCIYLLSKQRELQPLCHGDFKQWLSERIILSTAVFEDQLWIGSSGGLAEINLKTGDFNEFSLSKKQRLLSTAYIQDITLDSDNNLWVATDNGLVYYRVKEHESMRFQYDPSDLEGLSSSDILSVFIDNNGLVWAGTYANGLNILDPSKTAFERLVTRSDTDKLNLSNKIHSIAKDRFERLWLASFGSNVLSLDLMTGELSQPFANYFKDKKHLDYAYSLLIDHQNKLWVGSTRGMSLFDLNTDKALTFNLVKNNEAYPLNDFIFQIYEDHDGEIWLATLKGLFKVERQVRTADNITIFIKDLLSEIPYSFKDRNARVSRIYQTLDGNYWIGGPSGLLVYYPEAQQWQHYQYQPNNQQSLSSDDVQSIFEDSRGVLWIGTANGLNKVFRNGPNDIYFERITKEQGLPNNNIYGILEDAKNQLWISTNLGLVKYSENKGSLRSYRENDGLTSDEFNSAGYFSDNNGVLYFGSINGVTVVNSYNYNKREPRRNLTFTKIKVGSRYVDLYNLSQQSQPQITKRKGESTIEISVSDLYYKKLSSQQYRYRILGLDKDWKSIGRERSFILAGLPQGLYYLDIQSKIDDEPWSSQNLRLKIIVKSNFIKSTEALYLVIFLALLTVMLTVFYMRRYYGLKLTKIENLVKIEEVRNKESKKLNDDLRLELESKVEQVSKLNKQATQAKLILATQEFRDELTGLYNYRYFRELIDFETRKFSTKPDSFNLFAVIEVIDFKQLAKQHNHVCMLEVISQIAKQVKQYTSSEMFISIQAPNQFILLGNTQNGNVTSQSLVYFVNQMAKILFHVANGVTLQSRFGLTYVEMFADNLPKNLDYVKVLDVLTRVHDYKVREATGLLHRVDFSQSIVEVIEKSQGCSIEDLIESNFITLNNV